MPSRPSVMPSRRAAPPPMDPADAAPPGAGHPHRCVADRRPSRLEANFRRQHTHAPPPRISTSFTSVHCIDTRSSDIAGRSAAPFAACASEDGGSRGVTRPRNATARPRTAQVCSGPMKAQGLRRSRTLRSCRSERRPRASACSPARARQRPGGAPGAASATTTAAPNGSQASPGRSCGRRLQPRGR